MSPKLTTLDLSDSGINTEESAHLADVLRHAKMFTECEYCSQPTVG